MIDYIKNHWNGNITLWKSYWLSSVLLGYVYAVVVLVFAAVVESNPSLAGAVLLTIMGLAAIPLTVWQVVGTWRSSRKYTLNYPTKYWGGVARFFIVVGVIVNTFRALSGL